MASFKDRPLKKCHSDKRLTIDVIHNNILQTLNEDTSEIKILKKKLKIEKNKDTKIFLENKINKLSNINNNKKNNYFLDNGLLLNNYYNNNGRIKKQTKPKSENNILNYFQNKRNEENIEENIEEITDNIIDLYLSNVDESCINNNFKDIDDLLHKCKLCNQKLDFKINNSELFCNTCGYTQQILLCNDKISYI